MFHNQSRDLFCKVIINHEEYACSVCVFENILFVTPTFCELVTEAETEVLNVGGQPGDVVDVLLLSAPALRHPILDLLQALSQVVGRLRDISDLTKI